MTHEEVWNGEIASLRSQAERRSGWVVCTPDAYLALMDFRKSYRAAVRLDKLNGTNRAARFSPDALCLGRVCRTSMSSAPSTRRKPSGFLAAWTGLASFRRTAS